MRRLETCLQGFRLASRSQACAFDHLESSHDTGGPLQLYFTCMSFLVDLPIFPFSYKLEKVKP